MRDLVLVSRAADFAARRHVGQKRKGAAREPYINHLAEVARLLAEATEGDDPVLVAAGWLHDTLEDTETNREELASRFGEQVAAIVAAVTDDKSLPQAERKRLEIEHAASKPIPARLLKIADKTSNLRSLAASPPDDWEAERLAVYVREAEAVVSQSRNLNPFLDRAFDAAVLGCAHLMVLTDPTQEPSP